MALLDVEELTTQLVTAGGVLTAVDGASLTVTEGETAALIGESGSGKTTLAMSLLRLLPPGVGRIAGGSARLAGADIISMPEREMRRLRGTQIALIPQDPIAALNPVTGIGRQMADVIGVPRRRSWRSAEKRLVHLLAQVHIPEPERRLRQYPHELSGGMLQRVLIAMAISTRPRLLVADEPTSSLDVTVQAGILDLLIDLQSQWGTGILLITHDIGVARQVADRINVMYAGRVVESGPVEAVVNHPRMPYTIGLIGSAPTVAGANRPITAIPGQPPSPVQHKAGCSFEPRCPYAMDTCRSTVPEPRLVSPQHTIRCLFDVDPTVMLRGGPDSPAPTEVTT